MKIAISSVFLMVSIVLGAQTDQNIYDIIDSVSEERLKKDVKTLVDFRNHF